MENILKGFDRKKLKKILLIVIPIVTVLAIILGVWFFFSAQWRKGKMVMPAFIANTGVYQGDSFRYFDGITVNGVSIDGMKPEQAKEAIVNAENNKKANYSVTVVAGEKSYVLTGNDIVFTVDSEKVLKEAKEYCISVMRGEADKVNKSFTADVVLDKVAMNTALEAVKSALHADPVDATFKGVSAAGIEFLGGTDGIDIKIDSLVAQLENFIKGGNVTGEITPEVDTTSPEITKEKLQENIQLIGTHSTTSTASANSTANMRKAMGLCDGSVIAPGATWSFNACTGDSNQPSAGWLSAKVISGGEFTMGYGGGICQASTTIYNAALYANLEIVTRYNHTYKSTYAKAGLDATVDYPAKDLKLKNNTAYPVYIQCIMEGKKLTVNIYGCPSNEFDKITLSTVTTEYVEGSHFNVSATRNLWKDGVIIKSERLTGSRYKLDPIEEPEPTPTPTPTPTPEPEPIPDPEPTPDPEPEPEPEPEPTPTPDPEDPDTDNSSEQNSLFPNT